ncbi:MAG: helix-turn-helix transcriptional regulator [Myxococcales bacterium]|nr:helix-turn-helix transcriptional regulator [Myxococcales bacterium]
MGERLGERIRRLRKERKLGLRETAEKAGMSASFLSRIESNDEKSPPDEEKIRALAKVLGDDSDILMTLAGRIPQDVKKVITGDPTMPEFLRTARKHNVTGDELRQLLESKKKDGR